MLVPSTCPGEHQVTVPAQWTGVWGILYYFLSIAPAALASSPERREWCSSHQHIQSEGHDLRKQDKSDIGGTSSSSLLVSLESCLQGLWLHLCGCENSCLHKHNYTEGPNRGRTTETVSLEG